MQIATVDSWYETDSRADGITYITEPHVLEFYRCNIWHVRGRERDMLVDSGMGVVSLRDAPWLQGVNQWVPSRTARRLG